MSTRAYCPQLPLSTDDKDEYIVITDLLANVKQNLRMIILTNPGEKLMDPAFGVGIKKYLFEPSSGQLNIDLSNDQKNISINSFSSALQQEIIRQVSAYTDDLQIENIYFSVESNELSLTIEFVYGSYYSDTLFIVF